MASARGVCHTTPHPLDASLPSPLPSSALPCIKGKEEILQVGGVVRPQSARRGWEGLGGGAQGHCQQETPPSRRHKGTEQGMTLLEGRRWQDSTSFIPPPKWYLSPQLMLSTSLPPSCLEHPGKGSPLPTVNTGVETASLSLKCFALTVQSTSVRPKSHSAWCPLAPALCAG